MFLNLRYLKKRKAGKYELPAYANAGGQGDRQASITCTSTLAITLGTPALFVDGITNSGAVGVFCAAQNVADLYIKFYFVHKVLITEAKFWQQDITPQGVWKWQGSNDDLNWTDIGANFTLGADGTVSIMATLAGNTKGYLYYRVLGVSGALSGANFMHEFDFKIGNAL